MAPGQVRRAQDARQQVRYRDRLPGQQPRRFPADAVDGVGELFGISRWITVPVATAFLLGLALTGSYRRVERIGIAIGLAELAFIPAMILARPSMHSLVQGLGTLPLRSHS